MLKHGVITAECVEKEKNRPIQDGVVLQKLNEINFHITLSLHAVLPETGNELVNVGNVVGLTTNVTNGLDKNEPYCFPMIRREIEPTPIDLDYIAECIENPVL